MTELELQAMITRTRNETAAERQQQTDRPVITIRTNGVTITTDANHITFTGTHSLAIEAISARH